MARASAGRSLRRPCAVGGRERVQRDVQPPSFRGRCALGRRRGAARRLRVERQPDRRPGRADQAGRVRRRDQRASHAARAATPASCRSAATTAPAAAGAPAKPATGVEITYLNQSRGQFAAITAAGRALLAQTGVKVNIDSPGPTDYPKKLQAAAQRGTMPDTYYALGAADMAPYYKAGWAMNLKPEMDKGWKKNFSRLSSTCSS